MTFSENHEVSLELNNLSDIAVNGELAIISYDENGEMLGLILQNVTLAVNKPNAFRR